MCEDVPASQQAWKTPVCWAFEIDSAVRFRPEPPLLPDRELSGAAPGLHQSLGGGPNSTPGKGVSEWLENLTRQRKNVFSKFRLAQ